MPINSHEPVYAVIIVFIILLFAVATCIGLRVFRKRRYLQQELEQGQLRNNERVIDTVDDEAINAVISKAFEILFFILFKAQIST